MRIRLLAFLVDFSICSLMFYLVNFIAGDIFVAGIVLVISFLLIDNVPNIFIGKRMLGLKLTFEERTTFGKMLLRAILGYVFLPQDLFRLFYARFRQRPFTRLADRLLKVQVINASPKHPTWRLFLRSWSLWLFFIGLSFIFDGDYLVAVFSCLTGLVLFFAERFILSKNQAPQAPR